MDELHQDLTPIKPFTINVPDKILEQFIARVRSFPWAAMVELDGWGHGTNLDYMKEFCAYWVDEYSWQ